MQVAEEWIESALELREDLLVAHVVDGSGLLLGGRAVLARGVSLGMLASVAVTSVLGA